VRTGIPVANPRRLGRIDAITIPAAEVGVTTHHGSPSDIDRAHAELGSHVASEGLTVGPRIGEYHHRGHTDTTDHSQWITEVAWPITDAPTPET
jgi:hypothetical protein